MSDTATAIHTIGQTPRPDLMRPLTDRFGSVRFEIRGALDGLAEDEVPACGPDGYPLETRLRGGARVVVDAAFLEPRLQDSISISDDRVSVHLVLCAGWFPGLRARRTLIQPFEIAAAVLTGRGIGSLEVVVPFCAQAHPAARKWEGAGFSCRTHVSGEKSGHGSLAEWLTDRLAETTSDALLFDYVGFPATILQRVADRIDIPVFDVGRLGMDALEQTLVEGKRRDR